MSFNWIYLFDQNQKQQVPATERLNLSVAGCR